MEIIPAIDFKDGKVVNLKQGRLDLSTTYSDDPVGMADHWVSQGCERLHLVDLDGAFSGRPANAGAISQIARNHPNVTIQLGGGIRDAEDIEAYLQTGVDFLIIGTKAVQEPEFVGQMCERFPGHIIVGLDGLDGMAAINGWEEVKDISIKSLAALYEADGIEAIIYTDINKDGMMNGVNIPSIKELADSVDVPIIASGGVKDMRDISALMEIDSQTAGGLKGVITGRALYEGALDLGEAIALVR